MEEASHGIDLRKALRALRALHENPDDTAQVFRIIDALASRSFYVLDRLHSGPAGRRLLLERPNLLATLLDRATLAALPENTLGRAYLRFLERENITTEGLLAASAEGRSQYGDTSPELQYVKDRMRDQHDLWHVVTGYEGDLIGEASLLAFSCAQTRNRGMALIVLSAWLRGRETDVRPLILGGLWRGIRAKWLPETRWEELLSKPLDEVRRVLGVVPSPSYQPVRTQAHAKAA
jgi:ubiquinone biosynthesis protein COQ4